MKRLLPKCGPIGLLVSSLLVANKSQASEEDSW